MDKIDIRDLIIRTLKENSVQENSSSLKMLVEDTDFEFIADEVVEKLPIYVVMQQRELLIALLKWLGDGYNLDKNAESIADEFLEENSN